MKTALTERLGIEVPVIQAPMGGASNPQLAAAVSEAGGLGMLALGCGFLSVFLAVPAVVGLPLGLAVRSMADHDLHEMRRGRMDPAGRRHTVLAQLWGTLAALLSLLCWVPFAIRFFMLADDPTLGRRVRATRASVPFVDRW